MKIAAYPVSRDRLTHPVISAIALSVIGLTVSFDTLARWI